MKIKKNQLKAVLQVSKPLETKEGYMSLQIENGILDIYVKNPIAVLKFKAIKTEEENTPKITVKRDFLTKIEKQDADEMDLKINQKTLTTKIAGVRFTTNLIDEDLQINIEEETPEGNEIMMTPEIIEAISKAKFYTSKDQKREILQGINLSLKNKIIKITATDSYRMFVQAIETDFEGEFNITFKQEIADILISINEVSGKKPFPITANNENIYISSKGAYFKSTLIAHTFPDINKVLEKTKEEKPLITIEITEEIAKKLKAIETKSNMLNISRKEKELTFATKSENETNTFTTPCEEGEEFQKKMNYHSIIDAMSNIQKFHVKPTFTEFSSKNTKIVIMNTRE